MVRRAKRTARAHSDSDEERTLQVIQNPDFVKMRAMQKTWSAPTTTSMELDLLIAYGLLQMQALSGFMLPGEHLVPTPPPGHTILFFHIVLSGLCFPPSEFVNEFCQFYGIALHHLTSNRVLFLAAFVHLCEVFIGIPPCLLLFRYFFRLKLSSNVSTPPLGCCVIQAHQGRRSEFFQFSLIDSVKWADKWFYLPSPSESFSSDFSSPLVSSEVWGQKPSDAEAWVL